MDSVQKLPDAELEVMLAIWDNPSPISTKRILECINGEKEKPWSPSTLQTLLNRLNARGFLFSVRQGKEKLYSPRLGKEQYLQAYTASFLQKHYQNSLVSLVATLYRGKNIDEAEVDRLIQWFQEQEGR